MEKGIDLTTTLTFASAFRFPLQSAASRREVMIGALLLLIPGIGWLLNMGHRIMLVHNMQHGLPAWPGWRNYRALFRHGLLTFFGMVEYYIPALLTGYIAFLYDSTPLLVAAVILALAATIAIPGYMSHYCRRFDPREIYDPFRALRRVLEGGAAYWHAWAIALTALLISFTGLIIFGLGFLVTSVWFWQVAGYSFATVFTRRFALDANRDFDPRVD